MNKLLAFSWLAISLLTACMDTPTNSAVPTTDPYVMAEQAQRTAQAAQNDVEFYGSQLTATAQAPIVAITATAAAWEMEQQFALATQQSQMATETAAWTATAMSWTPTPNATTTAVFANSQAEATKIANEIEINNLQVERARTTNTMRAMSLYVVGFLAVLVAVMFGIVTVRRLSVRENPVDTRGNPLPMIDVVEGIAFDIDRSPNGMISTRPAYLKQLPMVTAERQDATTRTDQMVDLRTRSAIMKRLADSQQRATMPTTMAPYPITDDELDIPLPPWGDIVEWDGKSLPLGKGKHGLITAQAASPHILISGKTGSGKTMFCLRTLVTAALSRGEQVINLGYSDGGFGVFSGHVNYHGLRLDKASDIIPCLRAVYEELQSRKGVIGGSSMDWEHWNGTPPRPFVRLVIDELGNMAEDIYVREGQNTNRGLWRWVAMIANEGRKVGIRFIAALQDPTAKSMDLRFRRNCTLVAFQQGDASQSSAFMGTTGAEQLSLGRFMARIERVTVGGGFAPTDEEIGDYLSRKQVPTLDKPKWLQIEMPRQESLPGPMEIPDVDIARTHADEEIAIEDKIRDAWFDVLNQREWKGWNEIERIVYGIVRNGSYQNKIKAKIAELEGISIGELREHINRLAADWVTTTGTTTTENSQKMPVFGVNPA